VVRDHLRSNLGIICGPGSFAVLGSFADPYSNTERWILGSVVKVCGPRTYLVKTIHKTRYVQVDHLIKAQDKVPNTTGELDKLVPELCEQSNLGIDYRQDSTSGRSRQSIYQM